VLKVADRTDLAAGKQFEASDVLPGENHDWLGFFDLDKEVRDELQVEVGLACAQSLQAAGGQILRFFVHVLHVCESLGA
jgi:hypothetical protein